MNTDLPFPELKALFDQDPLAMVDHVPGIFLVDKPRDMTSHDVVAIARKRLKMKKVGHGGTLDPMAEGLLLVLAGRATRLFDAMQTFTKTYRTVLELGRRTDTHDATGQVIAEADPDLLPVSQERILEALAPFRGPIEQVPPMFSALKKGGKKLYELARQGVEVEREARPVTVHSLELIRCDHTEVELDMTVSKGFYVRTLVDDLGQALGVGAVMTRLVRTAIGPFQLSEAVGPKEIQRKEQQ